MRSTLTFILLTLGMLVSGSALAAFTAEDAAKLGKESTAALATLTKDSEDAKKLIDIAKGVLVCPSITKGGFVIGVESGTCEMHIDSKVAEHYNTSAAKFGLLAGVQSYSMVLVFNDQAALDKFRTDDREWEVGVDASVAVAKVGASGKMDSTNMKEAIVAFIFGEKGLMADLSLEGSSFKKIKIEK